MLLLNGSISFGTTTGSNEPDAYGMPTSGMDWGSEIPCMYKAVTDDHRGRYEDGKFHQSAFIVHVKEHITAHRAKLYTVDGKVLGEFPIQSITKFRLLNVTEITLGV